MTSASLPAAPTGEPPLRALPVLGGVFLLYLPLVFFSYGTDGDMYAVVDTGRALIEQGVYVPSRIPGYPLHELAVGILDAVGGHALSNLGTVGMFLLSLWCFMRICVHFNVPHVRVSLALMVLHPLVWANATATADFFWAIGFILLGFVVGLQNRHLLAGMLFGLAIGSRFTSPLALAGILLFFLFTNWEDRWRWVACGAAMLATAFALFVPSLAQAGWSLSGLGPVGQGGAEYWGLYMTLGRYVYKTVGFWGIPGFFFLLALGVLAWRNRGPLPDPRWRPLLWLCLYEVAAYQLMFMYYPFKQEYLLPSLPFFLIGASILLREKRSLLVTLAVLVTSMNLVGFDVARPNVAHRATGASYGFWVAPGYVQREVSARLRVTHCETRKCFARDRGEPM